MLHLWLPCMVNNRSDDINYIIYALDISSELGTQVRELLNAVVSKSLVNKTFVVNRKISRVLISSQRLCNIIITLDEIIVAA